VTQISGQAPLIRAILAVGGLALAFGPWLFDDVTQIFLTQFFCMLVLALMWNLLAGYADIVTLGQHGFVGVGAYALYGFTALGGINPYVAALLAGLVALGVAVPTMALVFRLRTVYLAVGTWVVAEALMLTAGKLPGLGQGSGASLPIAVARTLGSTPSARFATIYWLAFALALGAFATTYALLRSRIGLGLTAMRDNEEAAGAMGVNLHRARVLCFLLTAPFLGMAGAVITLQKLRVSPLSSFSINEWTVFVIFNVVIGGIGSLEGPILGTLLYFVLRDYLSDLGPWHLIILGALSITMMLLEPRGLWGLLRRLLKFDVIPVSRSPSREFVARFDRGPKEQSEREMSANPAE
jgi:branched-chain amino acid transport system permease protein